MLVSNVEVDQLAGEVEVFLARRIGEIRALTANDFNGVKRSLC